MEKGGYLDWSLCAITQKEALGTVEFTWAGPWFTSLPLMLTALPVCWLFTCCNHFGTQDVAAT